jgi:hypothetical protein
MLQSPSQPRPLILVKMYQTCCKPNLYTSLRELLFFFFFFFFFFFPLLRGRSNSRPTRFESLCSRSFLNRLKHHLVNVRSMAGFVRQRLDLSLLDVDMTKYTVTLTSRATYGQASPCYSGPPGESWSRKTVRHCHLPIEASGLPSFHDNGRYIMLAAPTTRGWINIARYDHARIGQPLGWITARAWMHYMEVTITPKHKDTRMLCAICQDPISTHINDTVTLPCYHVFHFGCYHPHFVLGARQCPSCRRSSHLACACRNCKLDWQLNGWLCSHFAEHGRCDHTGAEQCTFDCANQDVVRLCPELEAQFRDVQRSCT